MRKNIIIGSIILLFLTLLEDALWELVSTINGNIFLSLRAEPFHCVHCLEEAEEGLGPFQDPLFWVGILSKLIVVYLPLMVWVVKHAVKKEVATATALLLLGTLTSLALHFNVYGHMYPSRMMAAFFMTKAILLLLPLAGIVIYTKRA